MALAGAALLFYRSCGQAGPPPGEGPFVLRRRGMDIGPLAAGGTVRAGDQLKVIPRGLPAGAPTFAAVVDAKGRVEPFADRPITVPDPCVDLRVVIWPGLSPDAGVAALEQAAGGELALPPEAIVLPFRCE